MNHKKPLIALDADGVLLDYNAHFSQVWQKAFGETLTTQCEPRYHATHQYGVSLSNERTRQAFFDAFDERAWESLPALPGAVQATQLLSNLGFSLVCVTSMPSKYAQARHTNLKNLGMPIEAVYATGRDRSQPNENPKKSTIDRLSPVYFVDDLIENFLGLSSHVQKILLHKSAPDSPNLPHLQSGVHDHQYDDLLSFSKTLTAAPRHSMNHKESSAKR
jgi:hypothetical protein